MKAQRNSTRKYIQIQIGYPLSTKQWINVLPPIAQAKLWNSSDIRKDMPKSSFKQNIKLDYKGEYTLELYNNPEIYADYWRAKKKEEQQDKPLTEEQCILLYVIYIISHQLSLIIVTHTHRTMGLKNLLLFPANFPP